MKVSLTGTTRRTSLYLGNHCVLLKTSDGDHLLAVRLPLGQLDGHSVVIPDKITELDSSHRSLPYWAPRCITTLLTTKVDYYLNGHQGGSLSY